MSYNFQAYFKSRLIWRYLNIINKIMYNLKICKAEGTYVHINSKIPTWEIGTTDAKVINPSGQNEFNIIFKNSYSVIPKIFITPRFSAPARLSYAVNTISATSSRIFVFNYGSETLTVTLDYFAITE